MGSKDDELPVTHYTAGTCKPRSLRVERSHTVHAYVMSVALVFFVTSSSALSEEIESESEVRIDEPKAILPSISTLLPPDSPLRLGFPEKTSEEARTEVYNRFFPLGAQAAFERGAILPKPWGISFF